LPDRSEITQLLAEIDAGGRQAVDRLYPLVYDELRRLAQYHLGRERPEHTLQATALVNEAYLKMVDQSRVRFEGRSHFFALAAQAMRRILVDYARQRGRGKRGGDVEKLPLDQVGELASTEVETDLVALDQVLTRLSESEPEQARLVEMRFFGGLSNEEAASVLGLSTRTAERYWQYARAWLYRELTAGGGAAAP